jgi:protein-arginine kinase
MLDKFDRACEFAYDDDLGFLTSRPYNLGNIDINVEVYLKALASQ